MLTVNADDWGGSREATDTALNCHAQGRITSVSAMVFMEDSMRAAALAAEHEIRTGLHLNFTQSFTSSDCPSLLRQHHNRVRRFLKLGKYAFAFYNPLMRESFRIVYNAQYEEFCRLYRNSPSHVDGHQHMHLCANMLFGGMIPVGERVRRSFTFFPGEKGYLNIAYRKVVNCCLARRYRVVDFFFCLWDCLERNQIGRVIELAKSANVEIMTHPTRAAEYTFLMSDKWGEELRSLREMNALALTV